MTGEIMSARYLRECVQMIARKNRGGGGGLLQSRFRTREKTAPARQFVLRSRESISRATDRSIDHNRWVQSRARADCSSLKGCTSAFVSRVPRTKKNRVSQQCGRTAARFHYAGSISLRCFVTAIRRTTHRWIFIIYDIITHAKRAHTSRCRDIYGIRNDFFERYWSTCHVYVWHVAKTLRDKLIYRKNRN